MSTHPKSIFNIYLILLIVAMCVGCYAPQVAISLEQSDITAPSLVTVQNLSKNTSGCTINWGDGVIEPLLYKGLHQYAQSGSYDIEVVGTKGKKMGKTTRQIQVKAPLLCHVLIETSYGNMVVALSEDTPIHRDNFLSLVNTGFYEGILFHRVINGFMIQAGDPQSKGATPDTQLGANSSGAQFTAEILPHLHHVKGALAAARAPDQVNPEKKSSGSQFYIVHGRPVSKEDLRTYELQKSISYSEKDVSQYTTIGGAPQLDQEYTIFGWLVEGMEVLDKIAQSATNAQDRPSNDVVIHKMTEIR